ncbi:FAD binding domain protein [Paraburkholderia xenovorans LB400]|uniref:Salicylate 1-monooxygenase n=1 Tax=Paraburkholderia xenovorans (strain LB400) TaxID=266265 RepID=Q13G96_PARXL|nr:FAD-dependent oxidoreductase [Paraburkholderia xenovorans]ABE36893.1 Salicylate 1-monooxygenase [Paraburkholderia xenovorans LB400]AIP34242.1 FAD binding domain protein [Paraburkholderia xenovorans LB400]
MNVAIIGGGIGGMCAALSLLQRGVNVTVYEQANELKEVGAGLRVTPNASRILRRMGLGEILHQSAIQTTELLYYRWEDGRVLAQQVLGNSIEIKFGAPYYHIHRAALHQLISDAVPREHIKLDQKCVRIEPMGDALGVHFANGDVAQANVVIGADGIHSVVRKQLHGEDRPRFSGDVAYRGLIPATRLAEWTRAPTQKIWVGPNSHFVQTYAGPDYINFIALVPGVADRESWSREGSLSELAEKFHGWDERIHELLANTDRVMCWPLYDRDPLPQWTVGHVTLLGDAAHPMLPYLGQGAAQAIEDAALIGKCLAGVTPQEVPTALAVYERLRRTRTAHIQLGARSEGNIYHLPDGQEQRKRDAAFQEMTGANASRDEWLFAYDVLAEPQPQ